MFLLMMGTRKNDNVGFSSSYDYSFKILLVGDSGVGKSSLLLTFISQHPPQDLSPTVGKWKIKHPFYSFFCLMLLFLPKVLVFVRYVTYLWFLFGWDWLETVSLPSKVRDGGTEVRLCTHTVLSGPHLPNYTAYVVVFP